MERCRDKLFTEPEWIAPEGMVTNTSKERLMKVNLRHEQNSTPRQFHQVNYGR